MSGKGSSPGGGWALEQAPQGSGHGPKLLEFKKRLDNALSHTVWFLGGPVWSQELDSMILMGSFQLGLFSDSMVCMGHCIFIIPGFFIHQWGLIGLLRSLQVVVTEEHSTALTFGITLD